MNSQPKTTSKTTALSSTTPLFPQIYWAHKVSLQKSAGQLERLSSLLAKSTIDLNPHHIYATIFALNSPLSRGAILADEVGLGKTIEAGIIVSQLWLEQRRRILIIVPASLRTQWRDELETHFGLSSTVVDTPYFRKQVNQGNPPPMTEDGIYIASLPFVYNRIELVEQQPWDLVVVDEAHRLRRVYRGRDASKMAYDLRKAIDDKPKLLLTATPLQNNLMELYGLVSFIDDKLLGSKYYFKSRFVDPIANGQGDKQERYKELRDLVAGDQDDDLFSPSGVIIRTLRKQVKGYINFPPRTSLTQDFTPTEEEQKLYDEVSDYLQRSRLAAIRATQRNLMIMVYRKLLASSTFAIAPTLKKLYKGLEKELKLRDVEQKLDESDQSISEDELIDQVEEVEEVEDLEEALTSQARVPGDFTNEEIKEEIAELKGYHDLAVSITENTKGKALLNALEKLFAQARENGWPEKAVVFTESRRTQTYLEGLLKEKNISFTLFNGSNTSKHARDCYERWKKEFPEKALELSRPVAIRKSLIHEFKTGSQVFLTTEAGAEGLNLQFCNIVINYDLPWNPQRIEQRIGRCHRYGQTHEVVVANMLNTENYADKRLLELLQHKLHLFDGIFGASDEILGSLEGGVDFEKRILNIYQNSRTPEEIDQEFQQLQEEMEFELDNEIEDVREKVLEQFDASILQLFKKTNKEVEDKLNEHDRALKNLFQLYYADRMNPGSTPGSYLIQSNGDKNEYLFREPDEEEEGKVKRMHADHEVAKNIIQEVKSKTTNPIPTTVFQYSETDSNIGELESHVGKEGFMFLFKLTVEGVETDELLVPFAFVQNGGENVPITPDASRHLIETPCYESEETIQNAPIPKDQLMSEWEPFRDRAVEKFKRRNQRLYVREEKRINRYWDNKSVQEKDNIEKIQEKIEEKKRKKKNTIDFDKKRELSQEIQKLEIKAQNQKSKQLETERDALYKKQQDLKELNEKLELNITDRLIAITKFYLA